MSEPSPFAIDEDLCAGHGRCYALAPGVFEADEMGRGHVRKDATAADLPGDPETIVSECPEGAITAIDPTEESAA